jgi:glutathione-regulated potassium-efflux system ancillary protein KefC
MTSVLALAALWFGLALIAGLVSSWFRVSSALTEIVIGIVAQSIAAQLIIGGIIGVGLVGTNDGWVRFLATSGAILLTFLAGAELDPSVLKLKWKEAGTVGLASFLVPFLGCTAAAHYFLGWTVLASWLAGLAMSTTSAAVVYAVTLEFGFNKVEFGKTLLIACFVTDVVTVVTLGAIFSPFTVKSVISLGIAAVVVLVLPWLTSHVLKRYGGQLSELETKFLLLCLVGMGALATWAESEAVLPSYVIGMVLAGTVGTDHALIRRLRTMTFGLLTPFFFILAGSLVSIPALIAAPVPFLFFFAVKLVTKFAGVMPSTRYFGSTNKEAVYTSLLMSTGLTFGTIAALFGRSHGIIDAGQYSALVAAIIGTAVIPTLVANAFFLPAHLLPQSEPEIKPPAKRGTLGKVLLANDGSENAFNALKLAFAIAKQNDFELHMMSVEEIAYMPEFIEDVRKETGMAARRFQSVLERARKMAEDAKVQLHAHVVAGHPVRSIVDLAAELGAELLVIGAKGHSALYERLIGSRADRIAQLAPCPVLIVKGNGHYASTAKRLQHEDGKDVPALFASRAAE